MRFKKMTLKKSIILCFLMIAFIAITFGQAYAVKIIPPRLVIKPDSKIEYMFIKNNSAKTEIYRFGWKHIAMNKQGDILNLDKFGRDKAPGYKAADDIIRFSPRRAVLQPGQTQRVTFMLRKPPELADGEYRSHFLVQREPKPEPTMEQDKAPTKESGNANANVEIDVIVSRSVPIYVLHGNTDASLKILGASLKKNAAKQKPSQPDYIVDFDVQKTGNRSVIGVANVFCTSSGEDVRINKAGKAFAVYAEGEFRKEKMAIEVPPNGCANMKLVIKGHPNDILAGQTLGEMIITQ